MTCPEQSGLVLNPHHDQASQRSCAPAALSFAYSSQVYANLSEGTGLTVWSVSLNQHRVDHIAQQDHIVPGHVVLGVHPHHPPTAPAAAEVLTL